jgi:CIC family chloride channel protein
LFVGATGGALFGHLCHALIPGLQVSLPAFAIAGMAGMIAGSTGAVLTGIIMIMEMTQDHRVMLPLILTTAVAYAIRRALMEEDIYTMKLVARGHVVPVGFRRPSVAGVRVRDLMDRDMAVKAGDGLQPDRDK